IVSSRQWLASNVRGAFYLDQHADASIRADMRLLAWQEKIENVVANGAAFMQFGFPVKSQKPRIKNTIALCLEVGIDHTNALVMAEVFEGLFLRAFPIGEMVVVEYNHASLGRDVRAVRPLGRKQAWSAIISFRPAKCFNFFTDRHEILFRLRAHS